MIYYLLHYYLFLYHCDNTKYDSFPRAGDGIAYALCTSLINSGTLQALFISSANYTTAATPEPCTHTSFNNKVRYITYFIVILFFIIATIQNMIAFPRAGDGIAYALCTSLINNETLQTLTHRQSDCTTAGCARTLHTYFIL